MRKLMVLLVLSITVLSLFAASCGSNKNSTEACLHETSLNLDKGNYDAVLASSCADIMQIGAAWFGKAGYDITNVLNQFIDTSSSTNDESALNVYMTSLTGDVTDSTLAHLDNAKTAYNAVPAENTGYQDALFYIGMVDAVKSLSVIKIALPNTVNSDGSLNLTCDKNSNGVPDDADATACALIAAHNISTGATLSCNGAIYSRSTPTDITLTDSLSSAVSGTYSGIITTITGTGPSCGTDTYNRLLYKASETEYWVATTTTEFCTGSDTPEPRQYYCPALSNIDFVATINSSLDSSISSLSLALTGTTSDVEQSVQDIKAQACCGCTATPCPLCEEQCTSQDLAEYIQMNFN